MFTTADYRDIARWDRDRDESRTLFHAYCDPAFHDQDPSVQQAFLERATGAPLYRAFAQQKRHMHFVDWTAPEEQESHYREIFNEHLSAERVHAHPTHFLIDYDAFDGEGINQPDRFPFAGNHRAWHDHLGRLASADPTIATAFAETALQDSGSARSALRALLQDPTLPQAQETITTLIDRTLPASDDRSYVIDDLCEWAVTNGSTDDSFGLLRDEHLLRTAKRSPDTYAVHALRYAHRACPEAVAQLLADPPADYVKVYTMAHHQDPTFLHNVDYLAYQGRHPGGLTSIFHSLIRHEQDGGVLPVEAQAYSGQQAALVPPEEDMTAYLWAITHGHAGAQVAPNLAVLGIGEDQRTHAYIMQQPESFIEHFGAGDLLSEIVTSDTFYNDTSTQRIDLFQAVLTAAHPHTDDLIDTVAGALVTSGIDDGQRDALLHVLLAQTARGT